MSVRKFGSQQTMRDFEFEIRPDNRTYETDWGSIKTGMRWVPLHAADFETVELSQCYTIGTAVDVDITVPSKFLHFRAGRDTSIKVTKVKGNIIKEILEWEVNSQVMSKNDSVEVMPSWRAHAQLLARKESRVIDFEVRTTLLLPNGVLPVYFKRRSDNGTAYEVKIDNFEEAFKAEEDGGVLTEEEVPLLHMLMETVIDEEGNSQSASKLQLLTRGTCVCEAWSDQKVDIKTSALSVSDGDDGDVQVNHNSQYLVKV
nr:hypothetical protein BaRGS_016800 [Batillaria attramentaria]